MSIKNINGIKKTEDENGIGEKRRARTTTKYASSVD